MGPVATKVMKGYSDEDISSDLDEFKVCRFEYVIYRIKNQKYHHDVILSRVLKESRLIRCGISLKL